VGGMKKAGLFDVRNIIGALLFLYGVILLLASIGTSEAEKAKADGINANLWVGLALVVFGVLMVVWAVTRPIVVDEAQIEADKRAVEEATAQSRRAAHHEVDRDRTPEAGRDGSV
jgi:TRAP-type C4-dicarboxylate transport system permease small subunit